MIVIIEEFLFAREAYLATRKMQAMTNVLNGTDSDGNDLKFNDLTEAEQYELQEYYEMVDARHARRMEMMARESSIQLTYQQALLVYQFVNKPLLELDFTHVGTNVFNPASPTALWVIGLILQVVSVLTSANSTFSPIIQNTKFISIKNNNKAAGLLEHLTQVIQVILHMIFVTGVVYLLKVAK